MTRWLVTLTVLGCVLVNPVVAEEAGARKRLPERFRELDANGDGSVTRDEVPAERRRFFARALRVADRNDDGALDARELESLTAQRDRAASDRRPDRRGARPRVGLFHLLDRDRDGKLSEEELARAPRLLGRLDRDGDGRLSLREIVAAGQGPGTGGDARKKLRRRIARLDKNKDGFLSRDEVKGKLAQAFERLDANDDGRLGPAELRAFASDVAPGEGSKKASKATKKNKKKQKQKQKNKGTTALRKRRL